MSEPIPEIPITYDRKSRMDKIKKRSITNVYKHGFTDDKPYKAAVLEAMKSADEQFPGNKVISHEMEQSEEHKEAGEYLIVLMLVDKADKYEDDKEPKEK